MKIRVLCSGDQLGSQMVCSTINARGGYWDCDISLGRGRHRLVYVILRLSTNV